MYPILVWYINKMATDQGGGVVGELTAMIATEIVPGSNPQHLDIFYFS
jgi:hypothetical protein